VLTTTLHRVLESADHNFEAGRTPAARAAYEDLLERAQARTDHPMEVIARAMLARCHLTRKDLDAAHEQIDRAQRLLDSGHAASVARWHAAAARVAIDAGRSDAARAYLGWAEARDRWADAIDACELLAVSGAADRAVWLQRAVDLGVEHEVDAPLGRLYAGLATFAEADGRVDEALDLWQSAYGAYQKSGAATRLIVGAGWAVGVLAVRTEDWPLAQRHLDRVVTLAEAADDCGDLLSLSLAELARIHEASGDVIEARRVLLRAIGVARSHDLAGMWPERWRDVERHARALEVL
jgi:tetratricopeptide (TPR) repeat protein